ncbi:hypothetical protein QJS10_CPA05g02260 [Acorus calamus]|uniref:Uncharacterized protein n=1 Tax=Acorus calamus TaxID=4465 RepID=A0AAV9EWP2_ACOCL|nr:hypothetical protein QJS10_CPA05g02260 [Acorus calamus]
MIQGFEWSVPSWMDGVVDLSEEKNSLFLAKELEVHARPRLDDVDLNSKGCIPVSPFTYGGDLESDKET